jgi:hypothetical protein
VLDTLHQLSVTPLAITDDDTAQILALAIGGGIAVIAIVFGSIGKMVKHQANEKTRREIAAYVAEGSISPEDAKKLLESKVKGSCSI